MVFFNSFRNLALLCLHVVFFAGSNNVLAFMQPKAFINSNRASSSPAVVTGDFTRHTNSKPLNMNIFPNDLSTATSILLSDDAAAIAEANAGLKGVRTFFVVISALVIGVAGLAFVSATYIVPQAAARLEIDTKRLRPGLWEEFEEKLVEGETMAIRPDLLQELGDTMRPIIIKDFEDSANAKDAVDVKEPKKNTVVDDDQWKD